MPEIIENSANKIGRYSMKYITAIRDHFNEIIGQVNGKIVSLNTEIGLISALFPNYIIKTDSGRQFNVMGIIQVADRLTGAVQKTVCLVCEPSLSLLMNPDTCPFNDMGELFVVGGSGRIYDKKSEISLLENFLAFRDMYIEKYNEYPGFPLWLSPEQTQLLGL